MNKIDTHFYVEVWDVEVGEILKYVKAQRDNLLRSWKSFKRFKRTCGAVLKVSNFRLKAPARKKN